MGRRVAVRENCSVRKGQNQHLYPNILWISRPKLHKWELSHRNCLKTGLSHVVFGRWNMLRRQSPEKLPDTSRVPLFSSKNKQKTREKVPVLVRIFAYFALDILSIVNLWYLA